MQFVGGSELEEKVKSARVDLERKQAAFAFNADASLRSRNRNHRFSPASTTPYGKDMTVARLFTSSPPSDTFTIANDVVDVDGSQAKRRSRAATPQQPSAHAPRHPQNQNHRQNHHRHHQHQHQPHPHPHRHNQTQTQTRTQTQTQTQTQDGNPQQVQALGQGQGQVTGRGGNVAVDVSTARSKQRQSVDRSLGANVLEFGYHSVDVDVNVEVDVGVDGGADGGDSATDAVAKEILKPSGLSTLIRLKKDGSGKGMSGPGLSHVIYLPNLSSFTLDVPMKFTVEETIYASIERHVEISVSSLEAPVLYLSARCYELRLHEGDGLPDEDFPALDRSRVITNFCHLPNGGEFCLCGIPQHPSNPVPRDPSLVARLSELQSLARMSKHEKVNETDVHVDKLAGALQLAEDTEKSVTLRITIPETSSYTVVPVQVGMKAYNILDKVQKKQRLPVYSEEYQFLISEKDRNRLSLLSCVIDMDTDVYRDLHAKGIRQIELKRRKFADTPAPPEVEFEANNVPALNQRGPHRRRNDSVLDKVAHERNSLIREGAPDVFTSGRIERPQPEKILFNDLTAAVYQEWDVIKTNKWSKRQKRVMGIDSQKVYNKSRKEGGLRTVKRAERLITDVLAIERVPHKPSCFRVKWRDAGGAESCVLEYEAEGGPTAAAEIIGKIKYIKTHAT